MLQSLSAYIFISFGGLYPAWLWINRADDIQHGFTRFNVGLGAVVLGLGVLMVTVIPGDAGVRAWMVLAWLGAALAAAAYAWEPRPWREVVVAVPALIGIVTLADGLGRAPVAAHGGLAGAVVTTVVGGLALCGAMYTMALGHWYLNAEKMPTRFLRKAIVCYGFVLCARLLWDAAKIVSGRMLVAGVEQSVFGFALSVEGLFVWISVFFGTLLPLVVSYLAFEALRQKSTQAATGLLYVAVSAAIIGEASYRFDLLSYGLAL